MKPIKYTTGVCPNPTCESEDVKLSECSEGADGVDQFCNECGCLVCESDKLVWFNKGESPYGIEVV